MVLLPLNFITKYCNERDIDITQANGIGSQFIFVIPDLNMVISTTGMNYEYNNSWDIVEGIKNNLHLTIPLIQ